MPDLDVDVNSTLIVEDTPDPRPLNVDDFKTSRTGAATETTLGIVQDLLQQIADGQRAALVLQAIAAMTVSGHRVVTTQIDGRVIYAEPDADAVDGPFWLTTAAAVADAVVPLVAVGEVIDPSWSWTARAPVYLHASGAISHVLPVLPEVFLVQIGVALTATSIFVDPQMPISLA